MTGKYPGVWSPKPPSGTPKNTQGYMKIDKKKPQPIKVGVLGLVVESPSELQLILSTDEERFKRLRQDSDHCPFHFSTKWQPNFSKTSPLISKESPADIRTGQHHGILAQYWPRQPQNVVILAILGSQNTRLATGMTTSMTEKNGEILTLDEVATYLRAGKRTVYRLAQKK